MREPNRTCWHEPSLLNFFSKHFDDSDVMVCWQTEFLKQMLRKNSVLPIACGLYLIRFDVLGTAQVGSRKVRLCLGAHTEGWPQ